jgi:RNA polymerase sigma factor (sigma-70 family)
MDCQELLRSNLALVERLVRFVCQRARVVGADVDDFASTVKLALIENDYSVLRAWEGRSSLATYLTVIIQRMLADERFRTLGRWRPSSEAKRMGEAGILLEMLLRRDERTLADAVPMVRAADDTLTAGDIEAMAARLPVRPSRMRLVEMNPVTVENVAGHDDAEAAVAQSDVQRLSERTNSLISNVIASLPIRDRILLRLRFVSMMSIADAARILHEPQRPLYRRLEQILAILRGSLLDANVGADSAEELIGSAFAALDFGLTDRENDVHAPVSRKEGTGLRGAHS